MSDSISFRDREFWEDQAPLGILYHFVVLEIDAMPDAPAWFVNIRNELDFLAHNPVGTLGLALEEFLRDEDKAQNFLQVVRHARERLLSWDDTIPGNAAASWNIGGDGDLTVWPKDIPVEGLLPIFNELIRLFKGY